MRILIRQIISSLSRPHGLDRGIEANGFQSTNSIAPAIMRTLGLEGDNSNTMSAVNKATHKGGNAALIGGFFYETNNFPIGMLMEKAITLGGGRLYAEKVRPLHVLLHYRLQYLNAVNSDLMATADSYRSNYTVLRLSFGHSHRRQTRSCVLLAQGLVKAV